MSDKLLCVYEKEEQILNKNEIEEFAMEQFHSMKAHEIKPAEIYTVDMDDPEFLDYPKIQVVDPWVWTDFPELEYGSEALQSFAIQASRAVQVGLAPEDTFDSFLDKVKKFATMQEATPIVRLHRTKTGTGNPWADGQNDDQVIDTYGLAPILCFVGDVLAHPLPSWNQVMEDGRTNEEVVQQLGLEKYVDLLMRSHNKKEEIQFIKDRRREFEKYGDEMIY